MKRLLFLCSGLEPGKDGVGDYTRLLAQACRRAGQNCALAALRDPEIATPLDDFLEEDISILRLPARMGEEERVRRFLKFRNRFQPDWLSLQLVPYAFHPKGLLSGMASFFSAVSAGVPLHVMFHELWLGAGWPSPLHHYAIGWWQARGIERLLTTLRPRLVTTSNPVYAAMLGTRGAAAEMLPLFGNVPCTLTPVPLQTRLLGLSITEETRPAWWIGIFFGALHQKWKPEPLFSHLLAAADSCGKKLALISVGRLGSEGQRIWTHLQEKYDQKIAFANRGEQSATEISSLLQAADFGIASSPWRLIGKSGTAAAMLDHGLPVIVSRDDFHPFYARREMPSHDPLVLRCDRNLEAQLVSGLPRRAPHARVDDVALTLMRRLQALQPASAP